MNDSSGFGSIIEQLQEAVRKNAKAPQNFMEGWAAWSSAIDWKEDVWIWYLLAAHVVNLLFFIMLRSNIEFQTCQFLLICVLVIFSEKLNTYCSARWQSFSTQNYFDEHGVFTCTIFAAPLLLVGFCQLLNFLYLASEALIVAKRLELRIKANKKTDDDSVVDSTETESSSTTRRSPRRRSRSKGRKRD